MKGFLEFVRKQGVMGLAVGFILGGAVSKVVTSLVEDIINPLLGIILGTTKGLAQASFTIAGAKVMYGAFIGHLIDFIVVALVVYYGVMAMKLDKQDKNDKAEKKD